MSDLTDDCDSDSASAVFSTGDQYHTLDKYFKESGDKIRSFYEAEAFDKHGRLVKNKHDSLSRIRHALHDLAPVSNEFPYDRKIGKTAVNLGLRSPLPIQSGSIFKPPHIEGEADCHQDSTFLHAGPLTCTEFWFALEDSDDINEGLFKLSGGHKGPLRNRSHCDKKSILIMGNSWSELRLEMKRIASHYMLRNALPSYLMVKFHTSWYRIVQIVRIMSIQFTWWTELQNGRLTTG